MAKILAGDYIKSNDPRFDWTVPVLSVNATHATIQPRVGGRLVTVNLARIYADGRARRQGYNVWASKSLGVVNGKPVILGHSAATAMPGANFPDQVAQAHVEGHDRASDDGMPHYHSAGVPGDMAFA